MQRVVQHDWSVLPICAVTVEHRRTLLLRNLGDVVGSLNRHRRGTKPFEPAVILDDMRRACRALMSDIMRNITNSRVRPHPLRDDIIQCQSTLSERL